MGSTRRLACHYAGISEQSLSQWLQKGALGLLPYVEFAEAVKLAEGQAVVGWLRKIEEAATNGAWQAAAWKLERRYPQEYGRTVQEHTGPDGGPLKIEMVRYADHPPAS